MNFGGDDELYAKALCDSRILELPEQELWGYKVTKADYNGAYNQIYIEYVSEDGASTYKTMYKRQ